MSKFKKKIKALKHEIKALRKKPSDALSTKNGICSQCQCGVKVNGQTFCISEIHEFCKDFLRKEK